MQSRSHSNHNSKGVHGWPAFIFDGNVQCIPSRKTSASLSAACYFNAIDQDTTSRCGGREELQTGPQPHFRLQDDWAIGIGRLVGYLQENNLMPVEQSAYRRNHSTETSLLRVISDLLKSMDKQEVTLIGLLDSISVPRSTVSIMIPCCHDWSGRKALRVWQSNGYDSFSWTWRSKWHSGVSCGRPASWGWFFCVQQGFVPCPLLFLLHTAELLDIIKTKVGRHTLMPMTRRYMSAL